MRFLVCILAFLTMGVSDAPERIAWSDVKVLQWSDFKGSPNASDSWAASSSTGMSQAYELDGNGFLNLSGTTVTAHFYPEYSWVLHQEKTKHLLGHEQTHFDITELYARKLRARIDEFKFTSNSKEEIRALYAEVEIERVAMQQLFDSETNHSMNHMKEIAWELKLERLLAD